MITTVELRDYIRSTDGTPYDGAVITAQLMRRIYSEDSFVGNEQVVAYSNSYGRFTMKLAPTPSDAYYFFTIRRDTLSSYRKSLPSIPIASQPVTLDSLEDVKSPSSQVKYIGSPAGVIINITPGITYTKWTAFVGDGVTSSFTTPGTIQLVALNGVVQSQYSDYNLSSAYQVDFISAPQAGDSIAIQYLKG